ncbi:MAG: hypothetical protein RL154_1234 [Pseudomonadota bacterium]|jgi:uncharacterized membrane protein (DUF373 family)
MIVSTNEHQLNFRDVRKHYRFTDSDKENLKKMVPIMTDWADEFTTRVFEFIQSFDDYKKYIPSEHLANKHQASFKWWFIALFSSDYDDEHLNDLFKIGLKHMQVGLPPHYVHATVTFVRDFINEKISLYFEDKKEREQIRSSCSKMLDMNLDLIAMSYREAELRPYLASGSFQRWLISFMERFSFSMDVVLSFFLVLISFLIIGSVVLDMIHFFGGNSRPDETVMSVLGTLLILWAISELLQEGIKHLRGGQFAISSFVALGLAASIREILIASLNHDVSTIATLTFTVLALGVVYYLMAKAAPKQKGE